MSTPTNAPNSAWMNVAALIFAGFIGATIALTCTNTNKAPAALPTPPAALCITQPVQTAAPPSPEEIRYVGRVVTITPRVKAALLRDDTLYPASNPMLCSINVDTDREGKTIILKGTVQTEGMKELAEAITRKEASAEAYKIDNQLTVANR